MEAHDIARITYELMRVRDDRQLMKWEDDRGLFVREIERLNAVHLLDVSIHTKDQETARSLCRQIDELKALFTHKNRGSKKSTKTSSSNDSVNAAKMLPTVPDCGVDVKPAPPTTALTVTAPVPMESTSGNHLKRPRRQDLPDQNVCSVVPSLSKPKPKPKSAPTAPVTTSSSSNIDRSGTGALKGSTGAPTTKTKGSTSKAGGGTGQAVKYIDDSGRNRLHAVREALPGHVCYQCKQYFDALRGQGIAVDEEAMRQTLQNCSRHKAQYSPPSTPAGFWDLTVKTPDDWK